VSGRNAVYWPYSNRVDISGRRQSTSVSASIAATELSTYQLRHQSTALLHGPAAWFQDAIHEVVRHLEDAPFMQLVRLSSAQPGFASYHIPEGVVSAPELWQGVAETLSSDSPDAVILVQKVDPHAGECAAAASAASHQEPCTCTTGDIQRLNSTEIKTHVEDACRQLLASGVAESILTGKVGDCCEDEAHDHHTASASSSGPAQSSILPFAASGSSASQRLAVRANAIPPNQAQHSGSGYWGVVVQSRHHMGVEGCYLLKAVRSDAATGCSCTHFSLTRVCQGDNLEKQFVNSWLI
jgi:hypothetical protein